MTNSETVWGAISSAPLVRETSAMRGSLPRFRSANTRVRAKFASGVQLF